MRIKLFEQFEDIHALCRRYDISGYTVNADGTVDVRGDVRMSYKKLTELPIKFGYISGCFYCHGNQLTTLDGSPREVGYDFLCSNNSLTTLKGGPEIIGGVFSCSNNKLKTLEGSPKKVGETFFCEVNQLWTLSGAPDEKIFLISCSKNPVYGIYKIFSDRFGFHSYGKFMESLDWNYLREGQIVESRFKDACEEAGVEVPKFIEGYRYI